MESNFDSERFDAIRTKSQQLLLEFIQTEVLLGMTFADVAATERKLGNLPHFEHAKQDAKKTTEAIRHFMTRITNKEARAEAERGCQTVERALADLDK